MLWNKQLLQKWVGRRDRSWRRLERSPAMELTNFRWRAGIQVHRKNLQSKRRREEGIEWLVKERRFEEATKWKGKVSSLCSNVKQHIATLRWAECLRKHYKRKERTRTAFYQDPYNFVKNLFVEEKTGTLKVPIIELEKIPRKHLHWQSELYGCHFL